MIIMKSQFVNCNNRTDHCINDTSNIFILIHYHSSCQQFCFELYVIDIRLTHKPICTKLIVWKKHIIVIDAKIVNVE